MKAVFLDSGVIDPGDISWSAVESICDFVKCRSGLYRFFSDYRRTDAFMPEAEIPGRSSNRV